MAWTAWYRDCRPWPTPCDVSHDFPIGEWVDRMLHVFSLTKTTSALAWDIGTLPRAWTIHCLGSAPFKILNAVCFYILITRLSMTGDIFTVYKLTCHHVEWAYQCFFTKHASILILCAKWANGLDSRVILHTTENNNRSTLKGRRILVVNPSTV